MSFPDPDRTPENPGRRVMGVSIAMATFFGALIIIAHWLQPEAVRKLVSDSNWQIAVFSAIAGMAGSYLASVAYGAWESHSLKRALRTIREMADIAIVNDFFDDLDMFKKDVIKEYSLTIKAEQYIEQHNVLLLTFRTRYYRKAADNLTFLIKRIQKDVPREDAVKILLPQKLSYNYRNYTFFTCFDERHRGVSYAHDLSQYYKLLRAYVDERMVEPEVKILQDGSIEATLDLKRLGIGRNCEDMLVEFVFQAPSTISDYYSDELYLPNNKASYTFDYRAVKHIVSASAVPFLKSSDHFPQEGDGEITIRTTGWTLPVGGVAFVWWPLDSPEAAKPMLPSAPPGNAQAGRDNTAS